MCRVFYFLFYSYREGYWRGLARVMIISIWSCSRYFLPLWQSLVWFQLFMPVPLPGQATAMQKASSESTCAETGPAFSQQLRLFQICHICPLLLWMVSNQDLNQVYGFINYMSSLPEWGTEWEIKRLAVKLWDKSCGQRSFNRILGKKGKTIQKAGTFQVLTSDLSKSWSYSSTVGTSDTSCIASVFVSISILPFLTHFLLLEEGDISEHTTARGSDTPMTNVILECVQN